MADTATPADIERASGGRYEVQSVVGQGGMGTVYLGINKELGSRVAIKVLSADVRSNVGRMARFRREAALSAQLSHPNIVPVFELQTVDDLAYLVMPFIEGVSLEQLLRESGPLSRPEVQRLLRQIGEALTYAHARGVVHRDVKPANILLESASGRWLLTDFGVAHVAIEGVTELTATDATIGTLSYMAPEQLGSAKQVDERADLYSLALVGCEALLGSHPEREGPQETAKALQANIRRLPPAWVKTLTWPLAAARDERPPNIRVWLDRLDKRGRRLPRLAAATVGAAAVLGTLGTLIWQSQNGDGAVPNPLVAVFPLPISGNQEEFEDLGSALALGVTRQIQMLPSLQTLNEEAVRTALVRRYGGGAHGIDTLLALARQLGVDEAVIGDATVSGGNLNLRIEVFDSATERLIDNADVTRPLDSLHALVSETVVDAFATRLAATMSGTPTPSLPKGLPAIAAYMRGDRALRRGVLEEAVEYLDRLIEADETFAPAYLKRALALTYQARPTEAGAAIRPAVNLAKQYRDRLDAVSQKLLDAVLVLVNDGDLKEADRMLRNILDEHPNAVDVWFMLGALQARFPALMGTTLQRARFTLNQVINRDPTYGLAHAVLIFVNAMLQDDPRTRAAIRGYLDLDSTSVRAQTARVAQTLVFGSTSQIEQVTASFRSRPPLVLENVAQTAGVIDPPEGTRAIAIGAIDALLQTATNDPERAVAGRMRLAAYLGSGDVEGARRFVREAPGLLYTVPQSEVDRWVALAAVTDVPDLAEPDAVQAAVERLRSAVDDPLTSRWLVARWARLHRRQATATADREFQRAVQDVAPDTIEAHALQLDLTALDKLLAGDTVVADSVWQAGTSRFALDRVPYGLVSSWWPMQLERIRLASTQGQLAAVQALVEPFRALTGFTDQMAWYPAFHSLALVAERTGDRPAARTALLSVLRNLIGPGARPLRDSLQAELRSLTP